jgi:hypothetical protein
MRRDFVVNGGRVKKNIVPRLLNTDLVHVAPHLFHLRHRAELLGDASLGHVCHRNELTDQQRRARRVNEIK